MLDAVKARPRSSCTNLATTAPMRLPHAISISTDDSASWTRSDSLSTIYILMSVEQLAVRYDETVYLGVA